MLKPKIELIFWIWNETYKSLKKASFEFSEEFKGYDTLVTFYIDNEYMDHTPIWIEFESFIFDGMDKLEFFMTVEHFKKNLAFDLRERLIGGNL